MGTRKQSQREALRERAASALRDLYHNATPRYSCELYGRSDDYAQSWFEDAARVEVEYIADGGVYGGKASKYRHTLEHPANAGRYSSERARAYYVAKGMREFHEDRERNAWERISEFGKLYQYGRGGRTLAPSDLIQTRGGSGFSIKEDAFAEFSAARLVDAIRILESFNAFVGAWCKGVPDMWREHCEEEDAAELSAKRAASARKGKETRERNYWAARDVATVVGEG